MRKEAKYTLCQSQGEINGAGTQPNQVIRYDLDTEFEKLNFTDERKEVDTFCCFHRTTELMV